MSVRIDIDVDGLEEAARKIKSVVSALESKDVEDVLVKGAQIVRDEAKQRAPVLTGRLKRSIKAKKGKRRGKAFSTAFAAVDRKIAPHSHLVEFGTRHSSAKPFFRPAVDATKDQVAKTVNEGLAKLIGKAVR